MLPLSSTGWWSNGRDISLQSALGSFLSLSLVLSLEPEPEAPMLCQILERLCQLLFCGPQLSQELLDVPV